MATERGLCRAHALVVEDPLDDAFERLDEFAADATERLAVRAQGILDAFIHRLSSMPPPRPQARGPYAPPPHQAARPQVAEPDPREVLGFDPKVVLTRGMIKERQRALAALFHPDRAGSTAQMQRVNAAAKTLLGQVK